MPKDTPSVKAVSYLTIKSEDFIKAELPQLLFDLANNGAGGQQNGYTIRLVARALKDDPKLRAELIETMALIFENDVEALLSNG